MAKPNVNNSMLTIDSKDIIKRIDELENHDLERARTDEGDIVKRDDFTKDETEAYEEWTALKTLSNEAAQHSSEWEDGATLIRDNHFLEYIKGQEEEDGTVDEMPWWIVIDWRESINKLQDAEYIELDFDGVTYWLRNE